MESCKDGDIPFVVQSPAPQVSFMPQLCVFDTPCVFENIDDARKAIDNADFQKEMQKIYKIRTMENAYHLQFWKQMGANPTPMSFSEVYIGLQQGTIDAQENAYEIIVSAKLYEQQKYLISTNAVPDYTTLIVSDEFYQGLTKEQQKIIDQAAETAQEKARESADDRRVQRQKVLEDEGMQIVDVDQKTWKQMQEKCQPVYDSIRKQAGDKLVDLYMGK